MNPTIYRASCGSHMGMKMHQDGGEEPCGTCLNGESYRRLAHELIPTRPTPPEANVITAQQAAANSWDLMLAMRDGAA